jgi:hypothetical protein
MMRYSRARIDDDDRSIDRSKESIERERLALSSVRRANDEAHTKENRLKVSTRN